MAKDGVWGEHPEYPRSDWVSEVRNNDTSLGCWDWVQNEIEVRAMALAEPTRA